MNKNLVNVPTSELEDAYLNIANISENVNFFSTEGEMLRSDQHKIYNELEQRGENMRAVILLLRADLANTSTDDIVSVWVTLVEQMKSNVGIGKFYDEAGEVTSEEASLIEAFVWILEAELKKRNYDVRANLYDKYYKGA